MASHVYPWLEFAADPPDHGRVQDIPALAAAGNALVRKGGCLGTGLSWMVHHLVAGQVLSPNAVSPAALQLAADTAKGGKTISMAVSEPKAGAHPKYLAATAAADRDGFVLDGEKTHITNGPLAHAFVVVALSEIQNGQKHFSAFLVPRDTPGLTVGAPMDLPFSKPASHGTIRLDHCRLPRESLLGRPHRAWDDMVMPFRHSEDRVMAGLVTGAMARLLAGAADAAKQGEGPDDDTAENLGGLSVVLAAANCLAKEIIHHETADSDALLIQFWKLARDFAAGLETLALGNEPQPDRAEKELVRDLAFSAKMGRGIGRIRQIRMGRDLIG